MPDNHGFKFRAIALNGQQLDAKTPEDLAKAFHLESLPMAGSVVVSDIQKASAFLIQQLNLEELQVEDALSDDERPALRATEGGLFMVATAVTTKDSTEKYVEVGIFMLQHSIITVSTSLCPQVQEWLDHLTRRRPTADYVNRALHLLLDIVVDDYFPLCDQIEDDVDLLEDRLFGGRTTLVADALELKRRILSVRRRLNPLRDVLNSLLRQGDSIVSEEIKPYLQDVYDHTLRVGETVDINRDILAGVLDAHLATISNELNIAMRILTVGATMLMTASLISGIYGMNLIIPETEWRLGYPFAIVLMVTLCAIEYAYFKKKGWL